MRVARIAATGVSASGEQGAGSMLPGGQAPTDKARPSPTSTEHRPLRLATGIDMVVLNGGARDCDEGYRDCYERM